MLFLQSLKCTNIFSAITDLQIASFIDSNAIFSKYMMEINFSQINGNVQSVCMSNIWSSVRVFWWQDSRALLLWFTILAVA